MIDNKIKQAQQLLKDIKSKINKWDERSQFVVKGVKNLSMSDLDTLTLYAETFIKSGGYDFTGLMTPVSGVAEVLKAYGIEKSIDSIWD